MLTLADLDTRLSVPTRQLSTPGPDAAQLERILRSAVRVPDHGKRVPFRLLRIAGPARAAWGPEGDNCHECHMESPGGSGARRPVPARGGGPGERAGGKECDSASAEGDRGNPTFEGVWVLRAGARRLASAT